VGALLVLGSAPVAAAAAASAPGLYCGVRARAPVAIHRRGGECRRAVGSRRIPGSCRPAHSPARGARAAIQPAANRRRAVHPGRRPGSGGSAFYTTVAGALRAHSPRARHRPHRPARHRRIEPPRLRQRTRSCCIALAGRDRADTRRCLTRLSARRRRRLLHQQFRRAGSERVRGGPGCRAHRPVRNSYGTRVAQHYLRRFPQRVRAADFSMASCPRPWRSGRPRASDAERALLDILRAAPPSAPAAPATATRAQLPQRAVLAREPCGAGDGADPSTGEATRFSFGTAHLATVLASAVTPRNTPRSCRCCSMRPPRTRLRTPAAQFLLIERGYGEALASGICTQRGVPKTCPSMTRVASTARRLADTFLGTLQLDGLEGGVPHLAARADRCGPARRRCRATAHCCCRERRSGHTPASRSLRCAASRTASRRARGFGHGQLTAPCMDRVLAQFLARARWPDFDLDCTRPRASAAVLHLAERSPP